MNLSNKSHALEDAAKEILSKDTLQEGNDDLYKWSDINKALMGAGFGAKVIVKVLSGLKNKKQ
jgi:hypothetical protein